MKEHIAPKQLEFNKLFEKGVEAYKKSPDSTIQEAVGIVLSREAIENVENNVIDSLEVKVDYKAFLRSVNEAVDKGLEKKKQGPPGQSIKGDKGDPGKSIK